MYRCEQHGKLKSEWCDSCSDIRGCDCSDMTTVRIKDFIYACNSGERTVTITLHYCETCGEPCSAEI